MHQRRLDSPHALLDMLIHSHASGLHRFSAGDYFFLDDRYDYLFGFFCLIHYRCLARHPDGRGLNRYAATVIATTLSFARHFLPTVANRALDAIPTAIW